jgi:hypothetical protein
MTNNARFGALAACLLAVVGATLQLSGPPRMGVQVLAALAALLVFLVDRKRRAEGAAKAPADAGEKLEAKPAQTLEAKPAETVEAQPAMTFEAQPAATVEAKSPEKPAHKRFVRPINRVWERLVAIRLHLQSHDDQLSAQRELTRRLHERLDQQDAENRKTQVFFEERLYAVEEGRLAELAQLRELREKQQAQLLRLQESLDIHKRELAAFEGALRLRDEKLSTLANVRGAEEGPLRATAG